jgi:predicted AAA+ superfamily ATPase
VIERHIKKQLVTRFNSARSIYIFGPRQSGKTTIAKYCFPELSYVSLEDPDVLEFAKSDPRAFLGQFSDAAIIDEPQRFPELFSYLQGEIDNLHKKFILTSSQNFLMMESISQSLAGRISILQLYPLTNKELTAQKIKPIEDYFQLKNTETYSIDQQFDSIIRGGYPEVNANPDTFQFWHSDYIKTYLEKDVRQIINVQDLSIFQRFLRLCAGRTGNLINKASLASDCGISESNCNRWLSLLEQSGIIFLLNPYHKNFNKRLIKSPKLYFIDTGLCSHLLGIKSPEHLRSHPLYGAIIETYVVTELFKNFHNQGIEPQLYFWRDQRGNEVDVVFELLSGETCAIEIKAGQTINSEMLTSIANWCDLSGTTKTIVFYGGSKVQVRENVMIIPIAML